VGEEARPVSRHEQIDLPGCLDDAIELVDPQDRTERCVAHAREHWCAGERAVARDQPVPLDTAGEPRIECSEVCRLEHRVAENQVAAGCQVL
jgi:hypothetical protein